MYAVIETGGKQYRVQANDILMVEKIEVEAGTVITIDKVVAIVTDGTVKTGSSLEGTSVKAKVLAHGKGKKIRVFKYKSKSNYRRRQGHRQPFTKVVIEKIEA